MSVKISASTNPPKTREEMFEYIGQLNKTNVDYIHVDVMDGNFVKAKTFGVGVVKKIKKLTSKTLDVHLMVKRPSLKIKRYIKAGSNILTIHYEAYKNKQKLVRDLQKIKKLGAFAGLSFCPSTSVLDILPYIYYTDMLLVMSVVPGKSGQEFMTESLFRLDTINKFLSEQKLDVVIEVDGGINNLTLPKLLGKNVENVVVGSYLYSAKNLTKTIDELKQIDLQEKEEKKTKKYTKKLIK